MRPMRIARAMTADGITAGLIDDGAFLPIVGTPFTERGQTPARTGVELALDDVELLAPVVPSRVLVILGGFLLDDQPLPPGTEPRLFPKVVTNHLGPNVVIPRPSVLTGAMEMEAEIALVVGSTVHRASPSGAWEAILGFTTYNDVTAAEFVPADLYRAKSLDGFSVFGPWISTDITREHIRDGLAITGRVNGVVCQSGNTARFKFDPGQVLSHASQYVTLLPGDIIALGTPPPAHPIQPGDIVEADVELLGVLTNTAG